MPQVQLALSTVDFSAKAQISAKTGACAVNIATLLTFGKNGDSAIKLRS